MKIFLILVATVAFMVKIDCRQVINTEIVEYVIDEAEGVVERTHFRNHPSCHKNIFVSVAQWFYPPSGTYFFTAAQDETVVMGKAADPNGWKYETSPGRAATDGRDCKGNENGYKPVHRVWNAAKVDWMMTADMDEVSKAVASGGYVYFDLSVLPWRRVNFYGSEIAGHCGATVPLYRCATNTTNAYSTSLDKLKPCASKGGNTSVMIYLWPAEEGVKQ